MNKNTTISNGFTNIVLNAVFIILCLIAIIVFLFISNGIYVAIIENEKVLLLKLLVPMGVLISAALASTSVMKSIYSTKIIHEENQQTVKLVNENTLKYTKSEFYMDKSISGLEHVYDLLKDQNNNRVTWIHASRMLIETLEISKGITEDNHKKVYHLKEYEIQYKLYDKFNFEEAQGMPIAFFSGMTDWKVFTPENYSTALNIISSSSMKNKLDPTSIFIIFDFIKFRKTDDPYETMPIPKTQKELNVWLENSGIDIIKNMKEYMSLSIKRLNKEE